MGHAAGRPRLHAAILCVQGPLRRIAALGVRHLFGLSTQATDYQAEAAQRLHLPFALLSDAEFRLAEMLGLPAFETAGMRLLKRLTLIVCDGDITETFYPVFPPDQNAEQVKAWLRSRSSPTFS